MRKQPDLSVNGLIVPIRAAWSISQTYEDIGGFTATLLRFADGAALAQQAWRKTRTTISGSGIVPPGLASIDWMAPVEIGCVASKSIQSASNVITIGASRRTDAPPYGFAILGRGVLAPVGVGLAGNVATLDVVAGAVGYQVLWYPLLTVLAPAGVQESFDASACDVTWQIVAEDV